ncbi:MAG TPA: GldG family protein [Spirochaetia bacterium]|nr:GldG family protein [Spirochaetales bacterium]HRS65445.1 GldG family protein [Spirochaetia bacterium]HRV27986.1 GldG family protein [Spirochaetia bacterium]
MDRLIKEKQLMFLIFGGLFLLALLSNLYFFRIDFTVSHSNTLSKVARDFYKELPDTVRITYFISPSLKAKHPGPQMIEDFLLELQAVSRGKIIVSISNPEKDTYRAESLGIKPQQMQVVEKSEQRIALVYSGIAVEYLDRSFALPVVITTDTLEYELLKGIRALVNQKENIAGILIGDGDKIFDQDYRYLKSYLEKGGYTVQEIERGKRIETNVAVLFVIGNSALTRYDAYFIDQYIMHGGRVFFAVKGVNINPNYNLIAQPVMESGIIDLLASYGIFIKRELVLDVSNLTVPFQQPTYSGMFTIQYVPYPHWIVIDKKYVNSNHILTARFNGMDLYWPSPIEYNDNKAFVIQSLIKTTPKAWKQTKAFYTSPNDSRSYTLERTDTEGSYVLGVAGEGILKTAFADPGNLPQPESGQEEPVVSEIKESKTRLVVITGSDSFSDLVEMMQSDVNLNFAVSIADWLVQSDDLLSIRTRSYKPERLDKIKDADVRTTVIILVYILTIGIIPLGFVITGLLLFNKRKKKEQLARLA